VVAALPQASGAAKLRPALLVPTQMKRKLGRLSPGTMKAIRQKLAEWLMADAGPRA